MSEGYEPRPFAVLSKDFTGTSSGNGNLALPLMYDEGVPLAVKLYSEGNGNCYTIIGRWNTAALGNWGCKAIMETSPNGVPQVLSNGNFEATLYYFPL